MHMYLETKSFTGIVHLKKVDRHLPLGQYSVAAGDLGFIGIVTPTLANTFTAEHFDNAGGTSWQSKGNGTLREALGKLVGFHVGYAERMAHKKASQHI